MHVVNIVDSDDRWRRVVLRMWILLSEVRWSTVPAELVAVMPLRLRQELEPEMIRLGVAKSTVLARTRLSDSKATKQLAGNVPEQCQHDTLLPRGGRTLWYTCNQCPARWPRLSKNEYVINNE